MNNAVNGACKSFNIVRCRLDRIRIFRLSCFTSALCIYQVFINGIPFLCLWIDHIDIGDSTIPLPYVFIDEFNIFISTFSWSSSCHISYTRKSIHLELIANSMQYEVGL